MRPIVACIVFALAALACGNAADEPPADADTVAAADEGTDSEAADAAGEDGVEEVPDRSNEIARDEGSRPKEVMDFLGIDEGDRVADIFAGGGYNTYLLSQRVGPTGHVYAQGYSPGLEARLERGDLAGADNVTLVDSLSDLPEETLDAVVIVRGYHLMPDPSGLFQALHSSLVPGGVVGVVEVRLGKPTGHDMETHRMGEQTVIGEFTDAGFRYVGESDVLRNPDDPHTEFWPGRRHLTDRMLLKFARPAGTSEPTTTAQIGGGGR